MIQPGYQFFYLCLNCIVSYHDNRNSDDITDLVREQYSDLYKENSDKNFKKTIGI